MIAATLARELSLSSHQVETCLALLEGGATVPFIARYRKEQTGTLTEEQIRTIEKKHKSLADFEKRKHFILATLEKKGELTSSLRAQIIATATKNSLEDLYLPYKEGRITRAKKAHQAGLTPIADLLWSGAAQKPWKKLLTPSIIATAKNSGFSTEDLCIQGVVDILAERISLTPALRETMRQQMRAYGALVAKAKRGWKTKESKFDRYYDFSRKASTIAPHVLSALFRGEKEAILAISCEIREDIAVSKTIKFLPNSFKNKFYTLSQQCVEEALDRLILPSISSEVLGELKGKAEAEAISVFAENLETILMAPPAGAKSVLAIDPGFRTGCKAVVLDSQGKVLAHETIYPTAPHNKTDQAAHTLATLYKKYPYEIVAVGNGTGGRETESFLAKDLLPLLLPSNNQSLPTIVSVSEAGASVYSASKVALEEFPDLDITIRGAISIGRRLQDPLAELVKVPAEAIGVGQYQHDINKKRLTSELDSVIESCVNHVGTDLNLASEQLLSQISGIGPTMAHRILSYRNTKGVFTSRKELLKVAGLGKKCFEQCAGFLRISNGDNILDTTSVHPERYGLVLKMAQSIKSNVADIIRNDELLQQINLQEFVSDSIGMATLIDIITELKKPARDPRKEFVTVTFDTNYHSFDDLSEGITLEGVVTNVVAFGAFVDIGVHQDGLVHISELADRYVSAPSEVVKAGDIVTVKVIALNKSRNQIGLSIKQVELSA